MANYTGAVRFHDGGMMFFSYQGTTDIARRRLFSNVEAVEHQKDRIYLPPSIKDEESVEVMPYFMHDDTEVMFLSKASRSLNAITGPLSLDEAQCLNEAAW